MCIISHWWEISHRLRTTALNKRKGNECVLANVLYIAGGVQPAARGPFLARQGLQSGLLNAENGR